MCINPIQLSDIINKIKSMTSFELHELKMQQRKVVDTIYSKFDQSALENLISND
jgi:hypothetical protein